MKTKTWILLALIVILAGAYFLWSKNKSVYVVQPLSATYVLDGQAVSLVEGKAIEPAAPGSAAKIITEVFGEPVSADLDGDGKMDAAVLLKQDPGGSGIFYYVAAALNTGKATKGTNGILLGDRIAPQNLGIEGGKIVANYAERKPDEPMTASPSVGVSQYFSLRDGILVQTTK